jgi:hypothetical protein
VSSTFTLNYGLRVEHEDGMREVNNNFTVGFDPKATSTLSGVTIPASVDPTGGTAARTVTGGLMYAGVNGNKTFQGDPPKVKWSPRVGGVFSLNSKTVLRAGYGLYWAPWNYPVPSSTTSNFGQVGFTQNTVSPQTATTPSLTMTNPFPGSLVPPLGSANGALTGVGTTISYVDQFRTAPRVQQYSADIQRELPGSTAVTFSYIGARGSHLPLGGTVDTFVNVNQLDPKYLALGASVLSQTVPNPFFGNPAAGPLSSQATQTRAQLLRPYPQFLNVQDRQVSEGRNRYDAGVIEWSKRPTKGGIGGRISYTYSILKDNQIGEGNFYTNNGNAVPLNNYNYIASMPACSGTNFAACYNPLAEYQIGVLDVPHRVIIAPIWQLPFGKDRRWGKGTVANALAGGWIVSAVVNLQSGFPIGLLQSDNTLFANANRPNLTGTSFETSGSFADRLASADHSTATWLNPAAQTPAAAGTYGDGPRLITDVRTPPIKNTDLSLTKNIGLSGGKSAQVKVEVINLFNRVQTNSIAVGAGSTTFGQISSQSGFMRLTQIMFRFSF